MAGRRGVGGAWEDLGRENALGAILTRGNKVADWDIAEFLATGRADALKFVKDLSEVAPDAPKTQVLDFGCGVGRITRALADHFEQAVGVDAARSMIDQARALHEDCARCRFVLNDAPHLRQFPDGTFGVVYCRLVLQHLRPALVRGYIPELVRVLAPGGVLMFQLPDQISIDPLGAFEDAPVTGSALKRALPKPLVRAYRRLKYRFIVGAPPSHMEMYGMPHAEVVRHIASAGGRILQVRPDASHGYAHIAGYEYWVGRS
jgi:SAM-dependent methyltransferase